MNLTSFQQHLRLGLFGMIMGIVLSYIGFTDFGEVHKMFLFAEHKPDLEKNPVLRWMRGHLKITTGFEGERFFVVRDGVRYATPLFLVLVLAEAGAIVDCRKALKISPGLLTASESLQRLVRRNKRPCRAQDRSLCHLASGGGVPTFCLDIRPDVARSGSISEMLGSWAADVCLLAREVYNVELSFLRYASNVGRLVRHAARRADRGFALVSVLLS